jgi:hypothetical protein
MVEALSMGRITNLSVVLVLAGCEPEGAVNMCPFEQPVRLASVPEGMNQWSVEVQLSTVGGLLHYTATEDDETVAALIDPCTGAETPYREFAAGPGGLVVVDTPNGRLLYVSRPQEDEVIVLDRLDVPGFDEPRWVEGVPAFHSMSTAPGGALLCTDREAPEGASCWLHDGDPAHAPKPMGTGIRQHAWSGGQWFVLDVAGALRRVDEATGAETPLLTGVDAFGFAGRYVTWQTGEEGAVEVHRLDVETGVDIVLMDGLEEAGSWEVNEDGTAIGRYEPGGPFEALFRLEDGEPLAFPPHIGVGDAGAGAEFELVLERDNLEEHVRALWDPFAGEEPREWFREALWYDHLSVRRVGDQIFYFIPLICEPGGMVRRADLRTGEHVRIAAYASSLPTLLPDGRYLLASRQGWEPISDVFVFDPATRETTPVVEAVVDWRYSAEHGVFYARTTGAEAGVWVTPLPPQG